MHVYINGIMGGMQLVLLQFARKIKSIFLGSCRKVVSFHIKQIFSATLKREKAPKGRKSYNPGLQPGVMQITSLYAASAKLITHPWRFDALDLFPDVNVWVDDCAPLELKTQLSGLILFLVKY